MLWNDKNFKEIMPYFQLGVFFSGALNYHDFINGNKSLLDQYLNITDYREKLIQLFTRDIKPFEISETMINEFQ